MSDEWCYHYCACSGVCKVDCTFEYCNPLGRKREEVSSPNSWIESSIDELLVTLVNKNHDYRIDGGEFSNFEFAAQAAGLGVRDVLMSQIAIKFGRIRGLDDSSANYESVMDSFGDLAGYAIIAFAYERQQIFGDDMTHKSACGADAEEWDEEDYAR